MAWIELHQTIWTHRKTLILAARLGIKRLYAAAHLIHLWTWAVDNAPEGDFSGLPPEVIAFGAEWEGEADTFLDALITAGWLNREGDQLKIHDWYDYAGRLIEMRKQKNIVKSRNKALYDDQELTKAVKERDKDNCRYCGREVDWKDRKSSKGATYDHINPDGPNSVANIVVACRGCNSAKGHRTPEEAKMVLLPPGADLLGKQSTRNLPEGADNLPEGGRNIYHTVPNLTVPNRTVPKDKDIPAPDAAGVCDPAPAENCKEQGAQQKSTKTAGKGEDYTPEFEKFWSVYPRRLEKLRAYKAWRTRRKENVTPDDMILAAENYAAHCAASGAEPRFIKHSATFLGPDKPFLDWIKPGKEERPRTRAPDDYEDLSLRWRDDRGG